MHEILTVEEANYIDFPDEWRTNPIRIHIFKPFLQLKMIGYWNNIENTYPHFPFPIENSLNYEKEKILSYLKLESHKKRHMLGHSSCRICGTCNGVSDVYDGIYIWPIGLNHYIERHNINLPHEFLVHVEQAI